MPDCLALRRLRRATPYVKVTTVADVRMSAAAQNQRASRRILCRTAHPPLFQDSHEHCSAGNCHRVRVVAVEQDHRLKTDHRLEDQRMNVTALLTMAVLVGWLATLITHSETDDVCLADFAIAVSAAALAGGLLAPLLGISPTGEFGLTLSGTLFSWGCATILLATVNRLRFGTLRRNRRAAARGAMDPLANTGHKV
jgi:uncharacterized membrane protein YeaQ/YmgE (transglycosylase-associated protein family)